VLFIAESYECPEGYSRCYGSRQCSLEYYFCDGEFDCDVGTDEDPAICGIQLFSTFFVPFR